MDIKYSKANGLFNLQADTLYITLDNGNEVMIIETEPGVLHVENITEDSYNEMGLMITPQNYSTIHIIPEG